VLVLAAAIGAMRLQESRFDRHSYARFDPVFAWIVHHAPSGHRIGISGSVTLDGLVPMLPSMGPRLGNRSAYVGVPVVHSLAAPPDAGAFASLVRRGRYDLLMIGRADTGGTDAWARALGYRLVVQSRRLALYRAPPS
jgi:hypothetical protein